MLNDLNLSKDVRAKVESIMNTQQEKIKDVISKGREANGDREKIMAEVRELQQNMAMSLKEAMGEEKFKAFMKNAPMFNRGVSPQGRDASR
jgi:gas vesicle protein